MPIDISIPDALFRKGLAAPLGAYLPAYLNWADVRDPSMPQSLPPYLQKETEPGLLITPQQQYACDFCWAFSAANMLSDRFAVSLYKRSGRVFNPQLSPSDILSCMTCKNSGGAVSYCSKCDGELGEFGKNGRCAGGTSVCAAQFLANVGISPSACKDFSWCANKANVACRNTGHSAAPTVNLTIPKCTTCAAECASGTCSDAVKSFAGKYKALASSIMALENQDAIKLDIYKHGPVIGNFFVMGDSIGILDAVGWQETQGVYCRYTPDLSNVDAKGAPQAIDMYSNTRAGPNHHAGNHSVVIVGWGEQPVTFPMLADLPANLRGQTLMIKYWIVRNTWGPRWNNSGYWKHAMSNPALKLNMGIGMDMTVKAKSSGLKCGGVLTFLPAPEPPKYGCHIGGCAPDPNGMYSEPTCGGRNCRCPNQCSGHGRCDILTGSCTCQPGYLGEDCSTCAAPPSEGCYADLSWPYCDASHNVIECDKAGPTDACCLSAVTSSKTESNCPAGWTSDPSLSTSWCSVGTFANNYRHKCHREC